ncbi:histidine kinase [Halostella sp. JP-L12]|uniref:DICT sensory domain-containing protein n=1 Tax=Halostella TaxID=1843185 RepID=UPI000EF7B988|nr:MULTISPECIES: DICT sensory domain-containing protein [Halostella]NHN49614.1 histidine kinase [Halostella sp. JP-L12]
MSLRDVVRDVEDRRKTLTVFNPRQGDGFVDDLRSYFERQNVTVRAEETDTGRPTDFAVLRRGDEVLTTTPADALADAVASPATSDDGDGADGSVRTDVLRYLNETTFTAYGVDRMLTASREIEDRAWRVGEGRLHAGFQYVSVLDGETDVYGNLAERPIDVHVYAAPDEAPPSLAGVSVHVESADEIERTWFVAFDGGGLDDQKCALLAEERGDRNFYGFWTYDPAIVDRIVDHLERRYVGR